MFEIIECEYGKLIDGKIKVHGVDFPIYNEDGSITVTGDSELLLKNGFKKIIHTEPTPADNQIVSTNHWEETDTEYILTWDYIEVEETEPIIQEVSIDERLAAIEAIILEGILNE